MTPALRVKWALDWELEDTRDDARYKRFRKSPSRCRMCGCPVTRGARSCGTHFGAYQRELRKAAA